MNKYSQFIGHSVVECYVTGIGCCIETNFKTSSVFKCAQIPRLNPCLLYGYSNKSEFTRITLREEGRHKTR